MRGSFWLILILLACTSMACADTTWVATGNVSGTWTAAHSPYMIGGDVTVADGYWLHIQPGVKVYFRGPYQLSVDGELQALGTISDTIRFTTDTLANPARWNGITLTGFGFSASGSFDYCVLEHAAVNGAVYSLDAPLTFNHCLLRNNRTDGEGGAISFVSMGMTLNCRLTLTDCLLDNNQAIGDPQFAAGGAVWAWNELSTDTFTFTRCLFRSNRTTGNGGAVAVAGGPFLFQQCRMEDNIAVQYGGGLMCDAQLIMRQCVVHGNLAAAGGGIVYSHTMNIPFVLDHCVLDSNIAAAGAAFAGGNLNVPPVWITNTIFCRSVNSAAFDHPLLLPRNCLFFGNPSGNFGPLVTNNIIGAIAVENANGDSTDFFRNLYTDPLFVNVAQGDYHLSAASPCIDAGDTLAPPDSDGTPTDIGAFPFDQSLPFVPHVLAFDAVDVGATDTLWIFMINRTADAVHIDSICSSHPAFAAALLPADSLLGSVDTLIQAVTFTPDSLATYAADLTIYTALGNRVCRLRGFSLGAYVEVNRLLWNFGAVQPGEPEAQLITLRNLGNTDLIIDSLVLLPPFSTTLSPCVVAPNQMTTGFIRIQATSEGTFRDTLRIFSNAYNHPLLVAIALGLFDADPPTAFSLATPADHDTCAVWWENMRFAWTPSSDPYGGPAPIYCLWLQSGEYTAARMAGDTALTVDLSELYLNLQEHSVLTWWVQAIAAPETTECAARFMLFTADTGEGITPEHLPYLPTASALLPAYPNPFNAVSTLTFDVAQTGNVSLKLYNLLGEEVATLVNSTIQPGRYHTTWNATAVSSGTYLAVLQTGDHRFVQKLLLLK